MSAGVLTASGVQTLQRRICPLSLCETAPAVGACSVQHRALGVEAQFAAGDHEQAARGDR
jgi:hypothetical protein